MQHTKLQEQMLHSCLAIGYTYLTHSYLLNDDVHLVIFLSTVEHRLINCVEFDMSFAKMISSIILINE